MGLTDSAWVLPARTATSAVHLACPFATAAHACIYEIRAGVVEEAGAVEAAKAVLPQVKKVNAKSIRTEQAVVTMYFLKRFILLMKMRKQTQGKHTMKRRLQFFLQRCKKIQGDRYIRDDTCIGGRRIFSLRNTGCAEPVKPEKPGTSSVIFILPPTILLDGDCYTFEMILAYKVYPI